MNAHRSRLAEPAPDDAAEPLEVEPVVVQSPDELKIVTRLREQHAAAHELWEQGMSKAAIGRKLGLHQATIRKLVNARSADDIVAKSLQRAHVVARTSTICTGVGTKGSKTLPSSTGRLNNLAIPEASWPSSATCGATGSDAGMRPLPVPSLRRSARSLPGS
ncbi:hypothetical protein [Streptomyces sioyaensis]|uniref:hypothetical protein n=1 Tax=Streptomyces sioyaensis TaxID=67364 RepID=UPI0036E8CC6C